MPTYVKVRMERHWGKQCLVCRAPITQKGRGRVRETCSHACREKLYRQRRAFYEEDRRADTILSQWRREFGDLGEDEWRLRLRVSRGMPVARCKECGKPYLERGANHQYCSARCRENAGKRRAALRDAIYIHKHGLAIGREVYDRAARREPYLICGACGLPFVRRARTGRMPKYCSKACRQAADRMRRKQRKEMGLGRQARRCAWCGKLLGWEAHGLRKYCGEACKGKAAYQKRSANKLIPH